MFGETNIGFPLSQLNHSHKKYVLNIDFLNIPNGSKCNLSARNRINVSLMYEYESIRNHHLIKKSFVKKT